MIEVSVVVPTYNRKEMLGELLSCLSAQSYPKDKYEVILVDDGSTDGTGALVKGVRMSNLTYVRQKNSGPSTARNNGIRRAKGRIVALLDDDCLPSVNWLKSMRAAFAGGVVAVEGKVVSPGKIYADSHFIRNLNGGMHVTCNMAFLKSVARFEEKYRYPNREDDHLTFGIIKNGGQIVFSKNAVARHRMLRYSLRSMIKRKLYFEADVVLFKKYPDQYRKKIRYPFDRFMPFYLAAVVASVVNPLFLAAIPAISAAEILYRKFSFSLASFLKLMVAQTLGCFVNVFAVLRGCIRNRVNPFRFFV